LGGRDQEDHGLRLAWGQKNVNKTSISTTKLGVIAYTSNSSHTGGIDRRIVVVVGGCPLGAKTQDAL
jgi:hypothetical protein